MTTPKITPAPANDAKPRRPELPPGAKLAYTVGETAAALGLSPATIWDMLKEGEIEAKRLRGRTLVPREEIERVLAAAPSARAA